MDSKQLQALLEAITKAMSSKESQHIMRLGSSVSTTILTSKNYATWKAITQQLLVLRKEWKFYHSEYKGPKYST